jgi:pimeloyl-ACP methyl ester carboxylesterase
MENTVMMWFFLILAAVVAIPLVIELTRKSMSDKARAQATGQFAALSQGITHYEWFGPPRGPVVVCVHGLTTPSFVWNGLSKGLALMGYRVLTYDLYGRGYSDRPSGQQNREFFLQQLNDLLAYEGVLGKFSIVGYSMGGAIVTHFTATYPERIQHLILLTPAGMGTVADTFANFIGRTPIVGDWLMLALYPTQLRKGISAERRLPNAAPEINDLQENELRFRGFVPAVLSSLRGLLGNALADEHKAIHDAGIPVLSIWGRDDDVIPLAAVGTLAQWSRNAAQEVVDGAGHGLPYTHTNEVLAIIRETLTKQN